MLFVGVFIVVIIIYFLCIFLIGGEDFCGILFYFIVIVKFCICWCNLLLIVDFLGMIVFGKCGSFLLDEELWIIIVCFLKSW